MLVSIQAIPQEWASVTGWTRSKGLIGTKEMKRPLIDPDKADIAPNLQTLLSQVDNNAVVGFLTSANTPIVIIDVDAPKEVKKQVSELKKVGMYDEADKVVRTMVIDTLPPVIRGYMSRTYCEWSLSRTGVHIVLKTDKSAWDSAYIKAQSWNGQLSIKNNYMVTTGNKLPEAQDTILEVPKEELEILFPPRKTRQVMVEESLPSIEDVKQALFIIPLDQSSRVQNIYSTVFNEQYEHYTFWLRIGMALHDYALKTNSLSTGLELFIKWSATDPVAFDGDEAVARKWASFHEGEVSYRTLFKVACAFQFNYPRRLRSRDGALLLNPDTTEYVNFKYLMDKYNLVLYSCGTDIYLKGDEDIIKKYFMLQGVRKLFGFYGPFDTVLLQAATWVLCQDSHWRKLGSTLSFVNRWMAEPKEEVDIFDLWLKTPADQLLDEYKYPRCFGKKRSPVPNTFEYVASCIEWADDQNVALCEQMLYRTFMQLIKLHDSRLLTFEDNGGMFALIGPENTYKTTFFKLLLPYPLEFLRKDINQELVGEKNKRDFIRYLSTAAIVLVDEFEGFMDNKKSGSFFKSIISGNITSFTDIYQTKELSLKRKAILVGTSNELRQIISDNGSRRLWFGRIKMIHTDKLLHVNLHEFYNNMKREFHQRVELGQTPWLMEFKETLQITEQNKAIKAASGLDIALRDIFAYTTNYNVHEFTMAEWQNLLPFRNGKLTLSALTDETQGPQSACRLMKTKQLVKYLEFHGIKVNWAELERALERFCTDFLGQHNDIKVPTNTTARVMIQRGQLCAHMRPNGTWNHKFWIMPVPEDLDE